jgi:hypothetical protein
LLLSIAACASGRHLDRKEGGVLLVDVAIDEARSAVVEVLQEEGFSVDPNAPGTIIATTGDGLAPDGYGELLQCGRGEGAVAAGMHLDGPGVDRPTGRFEILLARSNEGSRLSVMTDFTAQACTYERGGRTCHTVRCESTGFLVVRIKSRLASRNDATPSLAS